MECVGQRGTGKKLFDGNNVELWWTINLNEREKEELGKNGRVSSSPSLKLVERGTKQVLMEVIGEDDEGYVSIGKSKDLNLLELKLGFIDEVRKEEDGRDRTEYQLLGTFNCEGAEHVNKWMGEGKYYVWKVEKAEDDRVMLSLIGVQQAEIFSGVWTYNGKGGETICDLKVVT